MKAFLLVCTAALALAAAAEGAGQRAADALSLRGLFALSASTTSCPSGAPAGAICYAVHGGALIRGLGRVTDQHTIVTVGAFDGPGTHCAMLTLAPDVMTVVGKGTIDASIAVAPGCNGIPTGFTITGGAGDFAGASGSGTFIPGIVQAGHWVDLGGDDTNPDADDILNDWKTDTWAGSLSVAGYTFDLTPPVISGATSRKIVASRGAKHVRVRFTVKARDAVDGPVPVTCTPRSGSLFRLGRTQVKCSASDSSANQASKRFTVNVEH